MLQWHTTFSGIVRSKKKKIKRKGERFLYPYERICMKSLLYWGITFSGTWRKKLYSFSILRQSFSKESLRFLESLCPKCQKMKRKLRLHKDWLNTIRLFLTVYIYRQTLTVELWELSQLVECQCKVQQECQSWFPLKWKTIQGQIMTLSLCLVFLTRMDFNQQCLRTASTRVVKINQLTT